MKATILILAALAAGLARSEEAPLRGRDAWGGRRSHLGVVNPVGRPADDPDTLSLRGEWLFSPRTPNNFRNSSSANAWRGAGSDGLWKSARPVTVPACWESYGFAGHGMGISWKCWWDSAPNLLNHQFEGNCFYQKKVTIPAAWKGKRIWFKVGAVNSVGWFWINDRQVALVQEYCRTPKYEVTDLVTPGEEAKVVAEVSNFFASRRGCLNLVNTWGGILRDIEFEATPQVLIDDAWVRGDYDRRLAEAHVEIAGLEGASPGRRHLRVTVEGKSAEVPLSTRSSLVLQVPLGDFRPWSPESPSLYWATVELLEDDAVVQTRRERFGVRKFEARGKEFYLNGQPFFVRGAGLHHLAPLEGVVPADRERIRRDVRVIRAAGFNQVRFHTECRWPEFFEVADEEGLMVMPELPYYGDVTTGDFTFDPVGDAAELWQTLRRHPSFAVYSGGNEGWYGPDLSKRFYDFLKRTDPDRLVFGEDAAPNPKTNGPGLSDMVGGPRTIWPTGLYEPGRPYVCHEYLNVCVKFDARLDRKFTGVWEAPFSYENRKKWLARFGLDAAWGDRLQDAQNAHQAHWRRFGLEHARLDPSCDGYSYWSLQDVMCPQTSPYEGKMEDRYREWHRSMRGGAERDPFVASAGQAVFDPFFGTKSGGESPAEVAEYNSPSCVLLDEEDEDHVLAAAWWKKCRGNPSAMWVGGTNRVHVAGERFRFGIWFAHYEHAPLADAELEWSLVADDGRVLRQGRRKLGDQAVGPARRVARETVTLPELATATRAVLRATVRAKEFSQSNRWHLWVFPKRPPRALAGVAAAEPFRTRLLARCPGLLPISEAAGAKAVIVARGSAEEQAALARGGQYVVSLAGQDGASNVALGRWWMGSQLGMVLSPTPLLSHLPHQGLLNPLLFRIVRQGLELPLADVQPADYRVVGEGRDACYLYLAESPLPGGAKRFTLAGLDVLSDTPEGTAILDGVLDAILSAPAAVRADGLPAVFVDRQPIDRTVLPVPQLEPFTWESKNGLLYRNGKPHYWIADGSDAGNVMASPVGLWLAKFHGTTLASVTHSMCQVGGREAADGLHLTAEMNESCFSWLREAIRLGMLTQCPEGFFGGECSPTLAPLLLKYPALREQLYDHGHHMGADPMSELGLAVLDAKRYPMFAYGAATGFFLPELNREPGPDPYNARFCAFFREWARRKYGTLEEANAVWKTAFATWDDVTLRHTSDPLCRVDDSCFTNRYARANRGPVLARRNRRARVRAEERRAHRELYWDWLGAVQADTTAATAREVASVRTYAPGTLVGTDLRAHQSNRDNYVSYDPVATDRGDDIRYVHSSGFKCYDYAGRPAEPITLHDAICWPLFTARYFRCNSRNPIVNSEDIVSHTVAAAPSAAALAENDLAGLAAVPVDFRRKEDGSVFFSCSFTVPARYENDRQDGSRRFYLAGVSPTQIGWYTLNGKCVGHIPVPGRFYALDVTDVVKFGEPNKLTGSLSGVTGEIPKLGCHFVAGDLLGKRGVYGEKQYKSQFWSYLAGGHSGVCVWHWNMGERLRPYQRALARRLEAAAEVLLPAVRFRREQVAFLYGYLAGAGLPAAREGVHHELMDWAGALEFTGHRYDVLGEELFRETAAHYPVVVAPDVWCVADETLAAVKDYVRRGGTLVLTPGSLGKTFSRYRPSGIEAFARGDTGKGRVVVLEQGLGMAALAERLKPLLPASELDVSVAPSAEFPCVERLLAGDATRKVLYLQNWGGLDQRVTVALPEALRTWKLTPLEGVFARTPAGVETTIEGSQGVAVCLLSAPGAALPRTELSADEKAEIAKVSDLLTFGRAAPGRKRVLFALDKGAPNGEWGYSGAEVFPTLVEAVRNAGAEADALALADWTSETLARYAAVIVTEGHYGLWQQALETPAFRQRLADYVRNGGSLFLHVYTGRSVCCNAVAMRALGARYWKVRLADGPLPRDEASCGYGDPRQILTGAVRPHPLTEGVAQVQLFALTPLALDRRSPLKAVVELPATSTHPAAPVLAAGEDGKGRVAVCADAMAFQPYRIDAADNARLLKNIIDWLLRQELGTEDGGI